MKSLQCTADYLLLVHMNTTDIKKILTEPARIQKTYTCDISYGGKTMPLTYLLLL